MPLYQRQSVMNQNASYLAYASASAPASGIAVAPGGDNNGVRGIGGKVVVGGYGGGYRPNVCSTLQVANVGMPSSGSSSFFFGLFGSVGRLNGGCKRTRKSANRGCDYDGSAESIYQSEVSSSSSRSSSLSVNVVVYAACFCLLLSLLLYVGPIRHYKKQWRRIEMLVSQNKFLVKANDKIEEKWLAKMKWMEEDMEQIREELFRERAKNGRMHEGEDENAVKSVYLDEKGEVVTSSSDATAILSQAKGAIEGLREWIQKESRRDVEERYGPGPYRVEFELVFPPKTNRTDTVVDSPSPSSVEIHHDEGVDGDDVHYLEIEMAPLSLMPHTVNQFLRSVQGKMWDNTLIVRNRPHVLVATPVDADTGHFRTLDTRTGTMVGSVGDGDDYGRGEGYNPLNRLAFREHSNSYPHIKGTVGLAGRPGGPNFYFNKVDNSDHHGSGPHQRRVVAVNGGADSFDLFDEEEGDPCFGTIVGGLDLLDYMSALPVVDDIGTFERPVVIRRAFVLTRDEDGGRWREH